MQYSQFRVFEALSSETPYGVPYRPSIWGAGWDIQSFGYRHYFLAKNYPDIFRPDQVFNAMNFILGCHPGQNTQSFASGVGAKSATVGYGLNRADWSYIPGGFGFLFQASVDFAAGHLCPRRGSSQS